MNSVLVLAAVQNAWSPLPEVQTRWFTMGNRIKELRDAKGMTQEDLAALMGTSQQRLGRLEREQRRLNQHWLEKAAAALEVRIEDIIDTDGEEPDVSEVSGGALSPISQAIARRGLAIFTCDTDAVSEMGVNAGDVLTVDCTDSAISTVATGNLVLVELKDGRILLRVFVMPSLVTTNRRGANIALHLDNPAIAPKIIGVVISE